MMMMLLLVMILTVAGYWTSPVAAAATHTINVALHAQGNYAMHGWVAGSEITTAGLQRAFQALSVVDRCEVFAPYSYEGLSDRTWDLVLVEGYMGSVPAFIHEVRASNREVVVLFYYLDTYPSLWVTGKLDVDAFLTNSRVLLPHLQKMAPASRLLHLAADPLVMRQVPPHPAYGHNVVYLGQFAPTKHRIVETLREVAPLGLSIYGVGWDRHEDAAELLPFWRGVLPLGDIASLYASAKVVLSTTEKYQRSLGMVNNRVFEALSCGAAVVTDGFPEMEALFGDHVLYYREAGDAKRAVEFLLENDTARAEMSRRGPPFVSSKHTYAARVPSVLSAMESVLALRNRTAALAATPPTTTMVGVESEPEIVTARTDSSTVLVAAGSNGVRTTELSVRRSAAAAAAAATAAVAATVSGVYSRNGLSTVGTSMAYRNTAAAGGGGATFLSKLSRNDNSGFATTAEAVRDTATAGHDKPRCLAAWKPKKGQVAHRDALGRERAVGLRGAVAEHRTSRPCDANIGPDCGGTKLSPISKMPRIGEATTASASITRSALISRGHLHTVPWSETLSAGNENSQPSLGHLPATLGSNGSHHHLQQQQQKQQQQQQQQQLRQQQRQRAASILALRPNAPTVLVIYRAGSPPPESLRWDIESAVDGVAGGARLVFLAVGEAFPDVSAAAATRPEGVERTRWTTLEHRLSLLLAIVSAGEQRGSVDPSELRAVGMDAAMEAMGYRQWCCSADLVAVYAEVGDALERHFLHYLAGAQPSRFVRTALLVPCSSSETSRHRRLSPEEILASRFRTERYELVRACSEAESAPYAPVPRGVPAYRGEQQPLQHGASGGRNAPAMNEESTNWRERPQHADAVPEDPTPIGEHTSGSRGGRQARLDGEEEDPKSKEESVSWAKRVQQGDEGPPHSPGRERTTWGGRYQDPTLRDSIEQALFGISRHATISVSEPREGALLAARLVKEGGGEDWAQMFLSVKVHHPYLRALDDGLWCVLLDGVQVGCRGDKDRGGVEDRGQLLAMPITVNPLTLPRRLTLEAVWRGESLEALGVVRRSAPVSVSVWPVAATTGPAHAAGSGGSRGNAATTAD